MKSLVFSILFALSLISGTADAAYQNPAVESNERQANGTVLITFAFSGNAGEPTVTRKYVVSQGTTPSAVRYWIDETIKELDLVRTAETLPAVQPGQTVTRLVRPSDTPPARRVWNEKFAAYLRAKDSGIAALAVDLAAMKADLEATYQSGYLGGQ